MTPAPLVSRIIAAFIDSVICCIPILGLVYFFTKDSLPPLKGQSIGRKIMKIKCVMEDGSSMEGQWVPCAIRQVVFYIPFFALVELYMVAVQNKETGLRLADGWAKTKVISCE